MAKIIIGDEVIENNNGEIVVNQFDGELVVSSRQIAENFGKQHKNVVQVIENLIKRNPELNKDFIESKYTTERGRQYKEYLLTKEGKEIMESKLKYNTRNARFEYKFHNLLKEFFPNENIIYQMPVLSFKVDFYLPFANMIIEYDEKHHKYSTEKDKIRIKEIRKEIMKKISQGIPLFEGDEPDYSPWLKDKDILHVIRVNEGEEIKGIREILITMHEDAINPIEYMK